MLFMKKNISILNTILLLFLLLSAGIQSNAQSNSNLHFLYYDDFQAVSVLLGRESIYGDKFMLIAYGGDLVFPNSVTLTPNNPPFSGVSMVRIHPNGDLKWHVEQNGGAQYNHITEKGDDICFFGRFDDYVAWNGDTITEDNDMGFSDKQYFVVSISKSGIFNYIKKFPKAINIINSFSMINGDIAIAGSFDSLLVSKQDTLFESTASQAGGHSDVFLAVLDSVDELSRAVNLGSNSFEFLNIMDVQSDNSSILISVFYFQTPYIDPTLLVNEFAYMQLDSALNFVMSRNYTAPLSPPFSQFNFGTNQSVLSFELNDTLEGIFPASKVYSGPEHFGYYKYYNGVFSPQADGIAFGGNQLRRLGRLNVYKNVFAEYWEHPNGIALNNTDINNAPYSISFIDMDSLSLVTNVSISTFFTFNVGTFQYGSLFVSTKLIDAVTTIDTFSFPNDPSKEEFLIANIVNCNYFKPEVSIYKGIDSLFTEIDELDIQWYYNGNPIPGANKKNVKIQGNGMHYARFSNYYGCYVNSNEIDIVSDIDGEYVLSNQLTLYPNPTKGELYFDIPNELQSKELSLKIINMNGMVVQQKVINSQVPSVDISSLPIGIYIYELNSENQLFRGKVVKQ